MFQTVTGKERIEDQSSSLPASTDAKSPRALGLVRTRPQLPESYAKQLDGFLWLLTKTILQYANTYIAHGEMN